LGLWGTKWCGGGSGNQKTDSSISHAQTGDLSSTTPDHCKGSDTLKLAPTGWQYANASAPLTLSRNFIRPGCLFAENCAIGQWIAVDSIGKTIDADGPIVWKLRLHWNIDWVNPFPR
jgi:hypothetical protein